MKPALVILAAGVGSRYGGLKQLAPIGPSGEALLEYSVFDALRAGFERMVLVVRPETEGAFKQRLDPTMAQSVPVAYVHQRLDDLPDDCPRPAGRDKPWGTGHAVLAVDSEIDGPFAVINADDFYGASSYVELGRYLATTGESRCLAAVGFKVADTLTDAGPVSRGLLDVDDEGRLKAIVELLEVWREGGHVLFRDADGRQRALQGDEMVSMNMWGFSSLLLPELRRSFTAFARESAAHAEFLLPDVIQDLVHKELFRVQVLCGSGEWCGITFRQDFERVQSIISSLVERGHYPKELWK